MHKALGAFAASLALLTSDVHAGSVRYSIQGNLPWSTHSGEQICDGALDSDRSALGDDFKDEFAIMGDGYSTVGGRTTVSSSDAYVGSATANRLGANEIDWSLIAKLSRDLSYNTHSYTAWIGLRSLGTHQETLWLMSSGPDIYARYYQQSTARWFACQPTRAAAARLSRSTFKTVRVRMTSTQLTLTVDGVAACTPAAVAGTNELLTGTGAQVAWGPPSAHDFFPMMIERMTSPYPTLNSALCDFTGDIQVRYCSVPKNGEMYGLLASQTGEAGTLRFERNGVLPTNEGADFTVDFGEANEDLNALTTLELFAESHDFGNFYDQCIREVLFKRHGQMVSVADFSPGVYVIADENDAADIASQMIAGTNADGDEAWYTLRTVPLSMPLAHPLKTVKLSWRACEVYGAGFATALKARALIINPSTDRFEYTQWLKIPAKRQHAAQVRDNVYWTIERPFTQLLFVEFAIDDDADADASTSALGCMDYLSLDEQAARDMSSLWVASADWRDTLTATNKKYCGTYGCKEVVRAIFEYAICSVRILGAKPSGAMVEAPAADEEVATAKCSNYNRFSQQSCTIAQEIATSLSSETTVETGDEYSIAIGQSAATTEEDNWSVSATVGVEGSIGPVTMSAEVTAGGGGSTSKTQEHSKETTSTTSTATGIAHAREVSQSVNCEGSADVPAGTQQGYELRLKRTEYTQQYTTDIKLGFCPEAWAEGTDASDPANFKILTGIPSESRLTETMMCEVVFNAPIPLRNAMKCEEEAAEAMLNGLDRFVSCQDDDAAKYDGCMCDAMNSLTSDACICVDESGTAIAGTMTFVSGTWQETCTRMNCANSKFGDGSGNAVPAPATATAQSSATGALVDGSLTSAKALSSIAIVVAATMLAMYAMRAVAAQWKGAMAKSPSGKTSSGFAYGAVEV